MNADTAPANPMNAEALFTRAENRSDGGRHGHVDGHAGRMRSERVSHARRKASAWLILRTALRAAALAECRTLPDRVGVRVNDRTVHEPDAVVHLAPNLLVVAETISPSSVRADVDRKLIDYFAVPSILHSPIVYGGGARVVHRGGASSKAPISTPIPGRDGVIELSPPGFSVTVEALLES